MHSPDIPFHDLPSDLFPITIESLHYETKKVMHSILVKCPGIIEIPGFKGKPPVVTKITFNGQEPIYVEPRITCPKCTMTSYNINDIKQGYCGNCHDWTSK